MCSTGTPTPTGTSTDKHQHPNYMGRIRSFIACLTLVITGSVCCGQNVRVSDYSFRKAVEAFYDEACLLARMGRTGDALEVEETSDVSISPVEASFMLKNDCLSEKDSKDKKNYLTASGEISEGAAINIKEVVASDITLKDIIKH